MIHGILNLPRNIWLIGLISLCNDSASEMLYPVIPLYLSSVLMAGPRALGIIEGIAEATASLLKLFSGVIMDRTRTAKPWIILGYSLAGFGRPLIALAGSWGWLLLIRFADRVGKGLRTSPRDALLASCAAPNQRGLAFGLHRAMDNAGAVIGPLLAFALLSREVPLAHIFLWAIVPALICLALSLKIRESAPAASAPKRVAFDWRLGDMPLVFKRYLVVVALFTLGNSSNMFLLLRAKEVGMPSEYVPLLWAAVSAVAMIFSIPLSALSDRVGRITVLVCGYTAYAIFYFGISATEKNTGALFLLFGLYGLFMGATEGVEKALVVDLVAEDRRGTAFGWFNLTTGLFLLPASVLFGFLYQGISPTCAFLFSGCCAIAAALLLIFFVANRRP
ncbi:MFS transporter [Desulfovibrio sp. 86]|uniref:Major facilitator superfamily MFS_1 n=1 Tax=uncultured Desulfovibrio sp. TaxID=167968 RepID=A0A212L3F6_9BACT|nr:MFS transporter [Desulfovibrio sp. 86]SCM72093.1 Major facilitator superfamily MFS_1 [uncultured Desulfovibrio sp.]VZH33294.1 Major facilitator superfamily MFS_1 [Desulfovibrio sp. 86]